jgi:hypothetical protein
MPLTKLQFRPGINREITNVLATRVVGAMATKFASGLAFPRKIGGWR